MTNSVIIQWVDEIPCSRHDNGHTGRRKRFVEELKTRPGQWAQYIPGQAHNAGVAGGFKRDFPGIEATARKNAEGFIDCYCRWPE